MWVTTVWRLASFAVDSSEFHRVNRAIVSSPVFPWVVVAAFVGGGLYWLLLRVDGAYVASQIKRHESIPEPFKTFWYFTYYSGKPVPNIETLGRKMRRENRTWGIISLATGLLITALLLWTAIACPKGC
jgi:hypothetical protein